MKAEFPDKIADILFDEKPRYIVLHGGRGGAKSWGVARALLLRGLAKPLRILCARETQKSISESVHRLLCDQIAELGLDAFYTIEKARIYSKNGTEFIFAGIRQNVANIKSFEAIDLCWVEEAQACSRHSWEILTPTIRRPGSQIFVTFNPTLPDDETYKRFVLSPPDDCVSISVNWCDNPWFPDVLRKEMESDRERDPEWAAHKWDGHTVSQVEGAIYAQELRQAERDGRITRVPYDPLRPVCTFWDLGFADNTAVWFAQAFPFEFRLIDYLEGEGLPLKWYQAEIQRKPYIYDRHFLPHDAKAHELGSGKSIEELMRGAGFKVQLVANIGVQQGISAVRAIFERCWFDGEKCADGLRALRHYRWAPVGQMGQIKREPLHDWASNGADGFRYFAVGIKAPALSTPKPAPIRPVYVGAWS